MFHYCYMTNTSEFYMSAPYSDYDDCYDDYVQHMKQLDIAGEDISTMQFRLVGTTATCLSSLMNVHIK